MKLKMLNEQMKTRKNLEHKHERFML